MKKIFTLFGILACMSFFSSGLKAEVSPAVEINQVSDYGFLQGLDGSDWTYTIQYSYENNHISAALINVYDNKNVLVGTINETFELTETDLWVNNVSISPIITKKFFNYDDKLEVMIFAYVATKDYQGRYFNNVYSLDTVQSSLICNITGNMILAENISTNPENDNYIMAFSRTEEVKDTIAKTTQLFYYYDIYEKAGYSTNGPKLVHTFEIPYDNIKALNDPMPITMVPNGTEMNYFISQYEKPYFVPGTPNNEDPVVNADNSFIIKQYDKKFNVLNETKIPMVKDPSAGYLYTFYHLGSLNGKKDIILDYNGSGNPAYVITYDNYSISSDGSVKSYYLYNVQGQKINTVAEYSLGTIYLNDIDGQPTQYAFLMNEKNKEVVRFVDVPTCEVVAEIDLNNGGNILSSSIDRVAKGDSYQYVIALLQGNKLKDGSVEQRIAWFDKNGTLNHYDKLNIGKNVELAQVNIDGDLLNPRLFHTDDAYEYLVLIQRSQAGTTTKKEVLALCNTKGEILIEWEPIAETKSSLAMIYVNNVETNPTLVNVYRNDENFTIQYYPLPLFYTKMQGAGTLEDPYLIASAGDFMQIENNPSAYYKVVNHIDFANIPIESIKKPFLGNLDGNNYAFYNLTMLHGGLFSEVCDSAIIQNLFLEEPTMILTEQDMNAGFIANNIRGGANDEGVNFSAILRNIHLIDPELRADGYSAICGGLVGEASYFTQITECSVTDAHFTATTAEEMGGIAGKLSTSSFVNGAAVSGQISGGNIVGGIAAVIGSGENISNCHVNAGLMGSKTIGGIVGTSERSIISNCLAEGTITFTGDTEGEIGGILGSLAEDVLKTDTTMRVKNCLVNVHIFYELLEEGATIAAHRIVGSTSVDMSEYDWDNIDFSKPQSEWPKIYGATETCLANNYVISNAEVIDATIAAEHNTTEGATLQASSLTQEWLSQHGFALGNTIDAPWVMDDALHLWFEGANSTLDIESVVTTPLVNLVNGTLQAEGAITVYNLNGMIIAQGMNTISTQALNAGVYIVAVKNNNGAATCKVLIP